MFRTKNTYQAAEAETLDDVSKKLAIDVRKHVRKLDASPIVSKAWVAMVESLVHIANIALMEHQLPSKASEQTLWEGEQLTVRFLLEEGKLNLCVRLMHEYKLWCVSQGGAAKRDEYVTKAAADCELSSGALKQKMESFEYSLGALLRCSLDHVEAVQTTDLSELMSYIHDVLDGASAALDDPTHIEEKLQEACVLRYLASIFGRIEELEEDRVMPLVHQHELMQLVVRHLHQYHGAFAEDTLEAGCLFLAYALDTEAYMTRRTAYLPAESLTSLKMFDQLFLNSIASTPEKRKALRPLLDAVARA